MRRVTDRDRAEVVRFWQMIEMFCPPEIPKVNPKRGVYTAGPGELLPWERGHELQRTPPGRDYTWRHTVYVGVYDTRRICEVLQDAFGRDPDIYDDRQSGFSALAAMTVNSDGQLIAGSPVLSTSPWAVGQLMASPDRQPPSLEDFADADEDFQDTALAALTGSVLTGSALTGDPDGLQPPPRGAVGQVLTREQLERFTQRLARDLMVDAHLNPHGVRIASVTVLKRTAEDIEDIQFLNSFYLSDLGGVAEELAEGNAGAALREYLGPARKSGRIDLRRHPEVVDGATTPERMPAGRWPSDAGHALALSQQFAVNQILSTLGDSSGTFAVNGPPGTGKTTMLRELIAANIVTRARALADLTRPADAFTGRHTFTTGERTIPIHSLDSRLTGFEMVVASSNNTAVENVTNEIPAARSIHPSWSGRNDYFADVATLLLNVDDLYGDRTQWQPAWAMLAARLGRKSHRAAFANAFWHGRRVDKDDPQDTGQPGLREYLATFADQPPSPQDWTAAVAAFRKVDRRVENERARRCRAAGPRPHDPAVDEATREKTAPWTDPGWNSARSDLFLAALDLHQAFLTHTARQMTENLRAAVDLLNGKLPSDLAEDHARTIWQSLFFAVPVVSTTFASFDRVFSHLDAEALGWLFIDEAGQANPQQAVGAIWRARRVVVVGDPLQLEPVRPLPLTAQEAIRRHVGVSDRWLPETSSVQTIADDLMTTGTYIDSREKTIWVGAPLRVHRRCDSPMFDICNDIAYDGLMISAVDGRAPFTTGGEQPRELPTSKWLNIASTDHNGHWIPAEGEQLALMLHYLQTTAHVPLADILVISPFKDVTVAFLDSLTSRRPPEALKTYTSQQRQQLKKKLRAGTVHTAQGKEADIVILLLGGDPKKDGAKGWAAKKPNLLNVAVSRAKRRLYVIGNRATWQRHPYFDVLATRLDTRDITAP